MYHQSGRYTLQYNNIIRSRKLLKRQIDDSDTDTRDDPTENKAGLIDFSIVLGVVIVLTLVIGIIALIYRKKLSCKKLTFDSVQDNNQANQINQISHISHINHIGSPNDEEYSSLDYYTNNYVDRNDVKINDKIHDKIDMSRSDPEIINNRYNIVGAPGSGIAREDVLKNHRGCTIITDSSRSDDVSISDIYKSDTLVNNSRSTTLKTSKSNYSIRSTNDTIKSNYDGDNKHNGGNINGINNSNNFNNYNNGGNIKRIHHQISLPTILPSASIYSQDRAYSIANSLGRSTTFQVPRPAPLPPASPIPPPSSTPPTSSIPPAPPVLPAPPAPVSVINHEKPQEDIKTLSTNSFENLIPSMFVNSNNNSVMSTKPVDSPTLHKAPWGDDLTSSKDNNEDDVVYDKKNSFISFERFSLFKDISKSNEMNSSKKKISSTNKGKTSSTNKERTSSANKERTSSTNKERTSSTNKERTSSANKERTPSTNKERTSSANKERTPSTNKGRTSSANKERTSSTNKEKTSSANKERTSSSNKERTSSANKKKSSKEKSLTNDPIHDEKYYKEIISL